MDAMETLAEYTEKTGCQSFTVMCLARYYGGQDAAWEAYFDGRLRGEVRQHFEAAISAPTMVAMRIMHRQIEEVRALIGEIRGLRDAIRQ